MRTLKDRVVSVWNFTKAMFRAYAHDNTFELGAALAYYTIFSIVPLLVVVISVSGVIAGPDAVRGQVFSELHGLVGPDTARALEDILGNAYKSGHGWLATVLGVITLILGASGVFGALKSSLNRMWEIKPKPRNSIVGFIVGRLLSFSFVLGLGFLMVVSFAINAVVAGFSDNIERAFPELSIVLLGGLSIALSVVISTAVFASLFKYLPDTRLAWRDVWPGALFTTVLFSLGKYVIALYFSASDPASMFGAAAGLISLLLWTFYSSQIFFLGAEFVYVWAETHGRPITPGANAVRVMQQEVMVEKGQVIERATKKEKVDSAVVPEHGA
ncbi:MAG: YihY/virulence factor BrkB family protein [Flavobacteriales bacterium]|nr:YihY/virulence factor BrkB family protein [Flavobacteriales bacterium]MBP6699325.1 YihY/virulence factor BrkB family protein [Flavobacteriales bacterium]